MLIRINHESGKVLTMRVSQVTVLTEDGTPVACAYDQQGVIIHSDATQPDWVAVCRENGLIAQPAEVLRS